MGDSLHVRHQARPELVRATLEAIADAGNIEGMEDLASLLEVRGIVVGTLDEQVTRLRKLGLLSPSGFKLTEAGREVATLSERHPSVVYDVLHYYHIAAWDPKNPDSNRFGWTYRTLCRILWRLTSASIDTSGLLERLFAEVMEAFPNDSDVSLSTSTVTGVLQWLEVLEPAVLVESRFQHRPFAPPELVVLAVDRAYRNHGLNYGELLPLDEDTLEDIAITCLLSPDTVIDSLREAKERFQWFSVDLGWGSFVRLFQAPDLTEDL